jgi:hypothetical protein
MSDLREVDVIARQAMKIERLEEDNERKRQCLEGAKLYMICIGGPLNDNKLGYSKEQLVTFQKMLDVIEEGL